jgi:phospholipid transport system transporter-binding protein
MKLAGPAVTNANAAEIVAAGRAAVRAGDLTIDFSAVTRCDTAAVACVLDWLREARAAGRRLELVGVPADLRSLAGLYNVEALIEGR